MVKKWISLLLTVILTTLPVLISSGCGSTPTDANNSASNNSNANSGANSGENESAEKFTDEQLDNLLAPIALYPDPLLAQMLPAATYPDDIAEAAKYDRGNGDEDAIKDQDWDISVKSVAHYPKVVYKLADEPEWTASVGQAYALQPLDVMEAIQRLRMRARNSGALGSTKEQEVVFKDDHISIYPAQPQYLYVPEYDPDRVYYEERTSEGGSSKSGSGLVKGLITFGAGVALGVWLTNAFDWGKRRVYYDGWSGNDGWRVRTRDYYRWDDGYYRNSYYVNDRYRDISINRNIIYRPVVYDRIPVYKKIYPSVTYSTRKVRSVPGAGDQMRRPDPGTGRPIDKGPPPGQIKKDKYNDLGTQPKKVDKPGNVPPASKSKQGPVKQTAPATKKNSGPAKAGPPAKKSKSGGGAGKGKGKKN